MIYIIEDDSTILYGLKYYLNAEKYEVMTSSSYTNARNDISNILKCELVILDINLGDGNGFDLLREIKSKKDIPVIILSANDLETSIVMGLDMGADDYITKPFKARELLSRIRSVLRRGNGNSPSYIAFGDVKIDMMQARVYKNEKEVFLTSLEYKILLILSSSPNVVFSREKILSDIWDVDLAFVNDNTLTVYIKRLREKIEDDINDPKIIKTVRGLGYKLVVE